MGKSLFIFPYIFVLIHCFFAPFCFFVRMPISNNYFLPPMRHDRPDAMDTSDVN